MGRSILTLLLASSVGIGGTGSQGEEPVAPSPAESVPEQPASPSMDGVATHTPTLFDDMGNYRREITTDSENAQRWFDQGLEFLYGFNHDEAVRSFEQALKHDPDCAMAWWGIAYARGPHINNPVMTEERTEAALQATREAKQRLEHVSRVERALIRALDARYERPAPEDRTHLDRAFAEEMARVWRQFPDDADVGALYAESMMNLQPWDLWTNEYEPKGRAEEIVSVLERVLEIDENHPGANHFYIHAYDSTELAHQAEQIARKYDQIAPDSVHALHMPSHIFVRLGHWQETVEWNERSAQAAMRILDVDPHASAHYVHALDYMMYGYLQLEDYDNARKTLDRVRKIEEIWPAHFAGYNTAAAHVRYYLEQGLWEQAAALDANTPATVPWDKFPTGRALFHYARGIGAARSGDPDLAETEREQISESVKQLREDGDRYWAFMTEALGQAVEAWSLYQRGEIQAALALIDEAASLEESMDKHPTTPGEVLPVRELHGDMLLEEGRIDEAREAFERSLERTPNRRNALKGIERAIAAQ